jgi:four helix bundle protein
VRGLASLGVRALASLAVRAVSATTWTLIDGDFCHVEGLKSIETGEFKLGTPHAQCRFMPPARRYSDLRVWKAADELRRKIFRFTNRPPFSRDLKAQQQLDDAINSVCRNIAEGFPCGHIEFARFLEISLRSLNEVRDALHAASLKGYITDEERRALWFIADRLAPALARFIGYLRRTPDPKRRSNPDRRHRKRRTRRRSEER